LDLKPFRMEMLIIIISAANMYYGVKCYLSIVKKKSCCTVDL
jgi:hypothetical protein